MMHPEADPAGACARYILGALEGKARATLAISGGSSPTPMFEIFARTNFRWERVQLFWVDERGVPPDDPQSNFKLANDHWLAPSGFPKANIHRIQAELDPEVAARKYTDEVREVFRIGPGAIPKFDVIHQGIGPDGHTASLFPGEPMIHDIHGIAAALWVEKFKQWRITLLPGVLMAARHTAMLVPGADKAEVLHAILEGPYQPEKYPAQILRGARDVEWFVDRQLAANG